jgi:Transcriptional regulators
MYQDNEKLILLFFDVTKLSSRFALRNSENKSNLMIGQYRCIQLLHFQDFMTQKELAEKLHIRSTSLSETITRLEEKGFIKRTASDNDKRTYVVSLTEEGKKRAEQDYKKREGLYSSILYPLSDDEKQQFENILSKIKNYYLAQEDINNEGNNTSEYEKANTDIY